MTETQATELLTMTAKLFIATRYQLIADLLLLGSVFMLCYYAGRKGGK